MVQCFQKITKYLVILGLIFAIAETVAFFSVKQDLITSLVIIETIMVFLVCGYIHYSIEKKL